MIGPAIEAQCNGNAPVNGLISGRIYASKARQEVTQYPRVIYEVDDGENAGVDGHTFDGVCGLMHETVTISCLARTRKDANRLGVMVRALFEGQSGTWGGIEVQGAFFERHRDKEYTLDEVNQDFLIYSRELTIEFVFVEPDPSLV